MGSAEMQGKWWGERARGWARLQEQVHVPLYEAAFDAAGVKSQTKLLDAGCGSGLALELAAKRGAMIWGLDASDALLAIAAERVPDGDLRVGELEELPYGGQAFDVVTAFNSVQYAANQQAAVAEIGRVTRQGGLVVIATWGQPQNCQTAAVLAAIGSLLPPPPPGSAGPFALSAPGALEALVTSAGLTPVLTDEVDCPFRYPDLDTAAEALVSGGPAVRAIEYAGEAATYDAIRGAFEPAVGADGSVRHDNTFRYVIATV